MKKTDPTASAKSRESQQTDGFNREDSTRRTEHESPNAQFAKNKRKRITRIEKNPREGTPRQDAGEGGASERRSFNPNFTRDNKLRDREYDKQKDSLRDKYKQREGGDGQKREFKPREGGARGGYGDKNRGTAQRFAARPKNGKFGAPRDDSYKGGEYPKFPTPKFDTPIRLNRYLAMSGISSRREADELIAAGLVTVNGVVITELGTKIMPTDIVKYNDNVVRGQSMVYIVMNKPKGYVTTLDDPHADKTVMDLLKGAVAERVYPVGRLDKNSLGVLLITNDGDMTKHLTHPTYNKKKIYQVSLDKPLTRADMEQIAEGIELEDGEIHADAISYVKDNKREVGIEIHSGRNRIVRRIFEHMGYKIIKLDRVYFAGLTKKNLRRGAWRFLSPKEVQVLRSGMYE